MYHLENEYEIILPSLESIWVGVPQHPAGPDFLGFFAEDGLTRFVEWRSNVSPIGQGEGSNVGPSEVGFQRIVMDIVVAEGNPATRAQKLEDLGYIAHYRSGPISIAWTEKNGEAKIIKNLILEQYTDPTKSQGRNKKVQLQFLSGFPYILGQIVRPARLGPSEEIDVVNSGNADSYPVIYAYGPFAAGAKLHDDTSGRVITIGMEVEDGDYIAIDTYWRTALLNGVENVSGKVGVSDGKGFRLAPRSFTHLRFIAAGTGGNTEMRVDVRSAWLE